MGLAGLERIIDDDEVRAATRHRAANGCCQPVGKIALPAEQHSCGIGERLCTYPNKAPTCADRLSDRCT